MHSFEVHSNESACRNSGRLGLEQVIRQRQSERKGALKATRNMGKVLHEVFMTVVKDIFQDLPLLGESSSEVSHFIPEPRK